MPRNHFYKKLTPIILPISFFEVTFVKKLQTSNFGQLFGVSGEKKYSSQFPEKCKNKQIKSVSGH